MKKAIALLALLAAGEVAAKDVVNIYSYRQGFLIEPILQEFTKETGIETKVVFAKKGLIEKLKKEGK